MIENPKSKDQRSFIDIVVRLLLLFWNRRKLIVLVAGSGTALVFLFCLLSVLLPSEYSPMPNKYTAQAILLVDSDSAGGGLSSILASYGMNLGYNQSSSGSDNVDLLITILHSRSFLDLLVEEFDVIEKHKITNEVKTTSRRIVQEGTSSVYDTTSNTLVLSCTDIDPEYTARFVNRQIELLEEWYSKFGGQQAERELHLLEVQLANQETKIALLEDEIKQFQRENNTLSIEDLAAMQSAMIGELRAQKLQIDLQIQTARQYIQGNIENENLNSLVIQRNNLNYLISQLEEGFSGGEKVMPSIDELPELAIQYTKLEGELLVQSSVYQRLKEQYEIANLNQERADLFSVMEFAEVPEVKDSPNRPIIIIIGSFVSLLIGFLIVIVLEYYGIVFEGLKEVFTDEIS